MSDIRYTFDDSEFRRGLRELRSYRGELIALILRRWAEEVIATAQQRYLNAGAGDTTALHSRTGRLSSAVKWWGGGPTTVFVGVRGVVYAAIHEFGGIIRARSGGLLVFETEDGVWHAVPQVRIPQRSYIRRSMEDVFERSDRARRLAARTLEDFIRRRWER